jgi:outer membrane receptor protein involved in Fe transport
MSFVRYNRAPSKRLGEDASFNARRFTLGTETLTIGLTQSFTPHMVNEIRLNGSRQLATSQTDINLTGGAQRPPDSFFFPTGYSSNDSAVTFSVYAASLLALGLNEQDRSRQLEAVSNLSFYMGTHQFRVGVDYRWFSPVTSLPRLISVVTFPSLYGRLGAYSGTIPQASVLFDNIPNTAFVVEAFSAYAQDTWKVGRRLTLTYGLRWEIDPAPRVSTGQAAIVAGVTNPADLSTASFVPSGKPIYATSWSNFAPRLGIGW